jgi:hypothetical protein
MRQPVESKRVMESYSRQRGFWHNVREEEGKNKAIIVQREAPLRRSGASFLDALKRKRDGRSN